ncbi:MAG TPA: hypothetical protein VNH83_22705 [Bryobacteraceae bacterium]|nr:hypothetical protein [Bryobacteraceae bacterium]
MNAKQARSMRVRRQVRIGKIKRVEERLRRAINEHRHLMPIPCDMVLMGQDFMPKLEAYRARHDRLLQAFAELSCERMKLEETNGS